MFKYNKTIINQSGFSMIELAVSIIIISTAFFGLWQALPFSLQIIKNSENLTKASYLAQAELEELRSLGYDNCGIGNTETKHRLGIAGSYLYYFQREANIEYIDSSMQSSVTDTGMKKINIKLYYTNSISKKERMYEINTILTKR